RGTPSLSQGTSSIMPLQARASRTARVSPRMAGITLFPVITLASNSICRPASRRRDGDGVLSRRPHLLCPRPARLGSPRPVRDPAHRLLLVVSAVGCGPHPVHWAGHHRRPAPLHLASLLQ